MTNPAPAPSQPVLSKSSLVSFILGLLMCLPLGLITILLAIIGFIATGKPNVKGRWMAIVGGILGLINTVTWTIALIFWAALIAMALSISHPPQDVAREFLDDLSKGDLPAAEKIAPDINEAQLTEVSLYLHDQGAIESLDLPQKFSGNTVHLEGTVKFASGPQQVAIDMLDKDNAWQVRSISVHK